jgi:hypothetical protein
MALKHKAHDVEKASTVQRAPQHQQETARAASEQTRSVNVAIALQRATNSPSAALRPADILVLQRTIGNRAVQRMLSQRLHAQPSQSSTPANVSQRQPEVEKDEELLQGKFATTGVIQRFPVTVEARGPADPISGGSSMTAKVGAESEWGYGSKPPGKVPTLMTQVGSSIQGTVRYIAGHLLNDNMGGKGVNNNLTVLSSTGNKIHRGVEGKVKKLAQKADHINRFGSNTYGDPDYDHGARYTVTVLAPAPDGNNPFSRYEDEIGAGLQVSIDPIRINKVTHVESPWPEEVGKENDLTNRVLTNVPPYPAVPAKKTLTQLQTDIVAAIRALADREGSPFDSIWNYLQANVVPQPTKQEARLALSRGVSAKFFYKRGARYKVISKNIP